MMNLSWFVGLGFMYVAGQEEAYEVVRVSFMVIVLCSVCNGVEFLCSNVYYCMKLVVHVLHALFYFFLLGCKTNDFIMRCSIACPPFE